VLAVVYGYFIASSIGNSDSNAAYVETEPEEYNPTF
jgi:hypothetical protein